MEYQFKGTLGPWEVEIKQLEDSVTRFDIRQVAKNRYDYTPSVCNGYGGLYNNNPSIEEGDANAHLIAASPDLLNACIMALEVCEGDMNPEVVFIIKKAIHKALNIK